MSGDIHARESHQKRRRGGDHAQCARDQNGANRDRAGDYRVVAGKRRIGAAGRQYQQVRQCCVRSWPVDGGHQQLVRAEGQQHAGRRPQRGGHHTRITAPAGSPPPGKQYRGEQDDAVRGVELDDAV